MTFFLFGQIFPLSYLMPKRDANNVLDLFRWYSYWTAAIDLNRMKLQHFESSNFNEKYATNCDYWFSAIWLLHRMRIIPLVSGRNHDLYVSHSDFDAINLIAERTNWQFDEKESAVRLQFATFSKRDMRTANSQKKSYKLNAHSTQATSLYSIWKLCMNAQLLPSITVYYALKIIAHCYDSYRLKWHETRACFLCTHDICVRSICYLFVCCKTANDRFSFQFPFGSTATHLTTEAIVKMNFCTENYARLNIRIKPSKNEFDSMNLKWSLIIKYEHKCDRFCLLQGRNARQFHSKMFTLNRWFHKLSKFMYDDSNLICL